MKFEEINRPGWTEQFWSKVHRARKSECWEWQGARYHGRYGYFKDRVTDPNTNKHITLKAHRYSYLLHFNEIPTGLLVCHHCDNPGCVNPHHLYLGTNQRNVQDACDRGLIPHKKGTEHGRSKYPEETIEQIFVLRYINKLPLARIAKELEISEGLVCDVLSGRRWQHKHQEWNGKYNR